MSTSCQITPRPKGWKAFLTSWYFWKPALGILAGIALGLYYFYSYNQAASTSVITSSAWSSAFFGGLMGFLVVKRPCCSC